MAFTIATCMFACDARYPPSPRRIPVLDGPWQTLVGTPDLGALNGPAEQPVDFALWRAKDGTLQLWSCIRGTRVGGESRLFFRWEGTSLEAPDFAPRGVAMTADPRLGETSGGLQAPYVIRVGDGYRMFYGDWEHIDEQTSDDGKTFTRLVQPDGRTALVTEGEGANTRDPMVLPVGEEFLLYDSANPGGVGGVYAHASSDLVHFGPAHLVARGGSAGRAWNSAESPHVLFDDVTGDYFLFRTQRYAPTQETRVYRSKDPLDFGVDDDRDLVAVLPVAAPEIFRDGDALYVAALAPDLTGIRIARLAWTWE